MDHWPQRKENLSGADGTGFVGKSGGDGATLARKMQPPRPSSELCYRTSFASSKKSAFRAKNRLAGSSKNFWWGVPNPLFLCNLVPKEGSLLKF